jgi:hypothetical protein
LHLAFIHLPPSRHFVFLPVFFSHTAAAHTFFLPAPSLFPLGEHKCRPTTSLPLLFLRPIYFPWTTIGAMPPRPLSSPLPHKTAAAASRRRPRRAAARPPLPPMTPCNLPPSSLLLLSMFQRLEQSLLRLRSGQPWRTTKLLSHGSIFPHPSSTHGERPMPPSSLSRAPIKFQQRAPPPIYAAPTSRAAGSLFCGAPWTARRRRPPCARCFAQPIRDAVENRGEEPPLFSMFIFQCV